jgi:3-hydroxybutyryl-CoA dehydrogenase
MSTGALDRVAVIGAGMMGVGIAQVFAAHGHEVMLQDAYDEPLAKAPEAIRANLTFLAELELYAVDRIEAAVARVTTTSELAAAARGAAFVVEAVFEDLQLKQQVFADLDELCPPETILATNTSVMSIGAIGSRVRHKKRVIGTHFWNPAYLVPLVEVVRTPDTAPEVIERTIGLLRSVGKHPIDVKKDVPGFVANRLQHALWREAFSIVEHGIADAETVDESIRYGFGLRLPVLGPLETAEMGGLDLALSIHSYIFPHLDSSTEPSPLLREKVERGELGFKTGRGLRDWSPEEAAASRRRLMEHLVRMTRDDDEQREA